MVNIRGKLRDPVFAPLLLFCGSDEPTTESGAGCRRREELPCSAAKFRRRRRAGGREDATYVGCRYGKALFGNIDAMLLVSFL